MHPRFDNMSDSRTGRQTDGLTRRTSDGHTNLETGHHGCGVVNQRHRKMQLLLEHVSDIQTVRQTDGLTSRTSDGHTDLETGHHGCGVVNQCHGKMQLLLESLHDTLRFLCSAHLSTPQHTLAPLSNSVTSCHTPLLEPSTPQYTSEILTYFRVTSRYALLPVLSAPQTLKLLEFHYSCTKRFHCELISGRV